MQWKQLLAGCCMGLMGFGAVDADKPYPMTREQRAALDTFITEAFPSVDAYVASIQNDSAEYQLGKPQNITNRGLFDAPTQFAHDGTLMIISVMEDTQIDIRRYDPKDNRITRLTHTPESEFSPRIMSNGKHFTAMRLEAPYVDRIWQYPLEGNSEPEIVFHAISPVGWHSWYDDRTALLVLETFPGFKETETGMLKTFAVALRGSEKIHKIEDGVGSCTAPVPNAKAASYVAVSGAVPQLKSLDLDTGAINIVSDLPRGGNNPCFAYAPNGNLFMMRGTEVWMRGKTNSGYSEWETIGDLADHGITGRVILTSISPDGKSVAFAAPH